MGVHEAASGREIWDLPRTKCGERCWPRGRTVQWLYRQRQHQTLHRQRGHWPQLVASCRNTAHLGSVSPRFGLHGRGKASKEVDRDLPRKLVQQPAEHVNTMERGDPPCRKALKTPWTPITPEYVSSLTSVWTNKEAKTATL